MSLVKRRVAARVMAEPGQDKAMAEESKAGTQVCTTATTDYMTLFVVSHLVMKFPFRKFFR